MSKYVAYLIDTLNHDTSISDLLSPNEKIQKLLGKLPERKALILPAQARKTPGLSGPAGGSPPLNVSSVRNLPLV